MSSVKIKFAWKLFGCNGRGIQTAIVENTSYEEACDDNWRAETEIELEKTFSVPARCLIYDIDEMSFSYKLKKIYYKARNFFRLVWYKYITH